MIEVPISNYYDKVARIDDIDRDLTQYKFRVYGGLSGGETLRINAGSLGRIIMARKLNRRLSKREYVDFIDRNIFNLQRNNLRLVTWNEIKHGCKRAKNNTTGFKGVSYHKRKKKYYAAIRVNNKKMHLGSFDTAYDAYVAYCKAAKKHFGEFACLE